MEQDPVRYPREGPGLAFERVSFFTDAVFAIALTLIVVGIAVPALTDDESASELGRALHDQLPAFVSFVVGVLVIGFYWTSHHASFDALAAVDRRYVLLTVPYLALIAFLPYPISLVGRYDMNPVSWTCLALNLAAVSSMETLVFIHSRRAGLLAQPLTSAEMRWSLRMATVPVPLFLISVPVAFVWPLLTPVVWLLSPVAQAMVARQRPTEPVATSE